MHHTTVQELIDKLMRVRNKSRHVWLEIKDYYTSSPSGTPLCNGGYRLHLYTDPAMPDTLFLSELSPTERPTED